MVAKSVSLAPSQVVEFQTNTGLPHVHLVGFKLLPSATLTLLGRLQSGDYSLTDADVQPILDLARQAVTASTRAADIREQFPTLTEALTDRAAELAVKFQNHTACTESCLPTTNRFGQTCRHRFPRHPSLFHMVARRPCLDTNQKKKQFRLLEAFHRRVQGQLRHLRGHQVAPDDDTPQALAQLLLLAAGGNPAPMNNQQNTYVWSDLLFQPCEELNLMIERCRTVVPDNEDSCLVLALYHHSLKTRFHSKFVPKRRISEAYIETYNPVLIVAANSNVSTDLVAHSINKLYSYCTKGGSSRTGMLDAAVEVRSRLQQQDFAVADDLEAMYETWREVTLGEAMCRLDRRLHLTTSNYSVAWVTTTPPTEAARPTEDETRFTQESDDNIYIVTSADILRYTRRLAKQPLPFVHISPLRPATTEAMCLGQFIMWYRKTRLGQEGAIHQGGYNAIICTPFDLPPHPHHSTLPAILPLTDGTMLRRRRLPQALDWGPRSKYASVLLFTVSKPRILC